MIEIEMMWLTDAFEDHSGMVQFYLDMTTGEVIRISDMSDSMAEQREVYDRIESEPQRWLHIEPLPSQDGFEVMTAFIATLPEGENKRTLQRALSYKKPFSNFKQAISDMPEIRKQWFAFHDDDVKRRAEDWLKEHGVEAILK